jgi:hypothetical protein
MRPIVIDNSVREAIGKVIRYAYENPIGLEEMIARVNDKHGRLKPVGDDPNRTIMIPMGYMVTFSIERQNHPIDWVRHISVSIEDVRSVDRPLPSLAAVHLLMLEFGFNKLNTKTDYVHIEELKGGETDGKKAVNILQKITPAFPHATIQTKTE